VPFERRNARARSSSSERSDWEAFAVGTDQPVGALVEEILLLHAIEMNTNDAVRASSWIAREVLRFPRLVEGHRADITCFELTPRKNLESRRAPNRVMITARVLV